MSYFKSDEEKVKFASLLIELIEKHNIDLTLRDDNGDTPLHKAIAQNCDLLINYFINKGADLHAENNAGITPKQLLNAKQ